MDMQCIQENYQNQPADCVILGLFDEDDSKSSRIAHKDRIQPLISSGDISLKIGSTTIVLGHPSLIVVGLGKQDKFDEKAYFKVLDKSLPLIPKTAHHIICTLTELKVNDSEWRMRQAAWRLYNQTYLFHETKSKKDDNNNFKLEKVEFTGGQGPRDNEAVQYGYATAIGMHLAKDLGNLPGNICTPSYLADKAYELSKKYGSFTTEILEEKQMRKHNMGAFLSVTAGADTPAKMILMHYMNGAKEEKPIVIVGKGITFDSGGISLKPGVAMDEMKYDMCGAASVFGVMQAVAELKLEINLICVIAAAENIPGPNATRPGDIVTTMSGQTVEILNTDAEGRLVLCDTLTYVEQFEPKAVIDVATLTGAMVMSLGDVAAGVMTNHQPLADELIAAGQTSDDKLWQMPIWEEYQNKLESNFADIPNIGPREAGSITAACYLSRFTEKYNWAHLDIAGIAWKSGKAKGATGRPVPMFMEYLLKQC